jgi:serine/threonine protein kinase/formylglycine-generating enzyme required for sulfatase activity
MQHDQYTSSDEPLSFTEQQEIDRLCSEFEPRWRAGEHPSIEDYLAKVASPLRAALLKELIAAEVDLRQGAGEGVQIDEYHQRFPDDRAAVEAGWAMIAKRGPRDPGPASTVNLSCDNDLDTGGDRADAHRDQPQAIPDMIGRYKILRELGEGGFGRVFLAHDTQLQRDVALKVPGRRRLSSATSRDAFLQEARAAARFKHPGLVVVHDVQQDGDDVYIVQEYIDGQDLSGWARANNPSPERIISLIKEVVDAVGFAHQHDLVHRDLKPANLLIDRQGHPHVADFGLALNESVQRLRKGEVCGTPAYMSPEQVRGLTHVLDGRSDLWSIGVILYELLTGRRPFGGANHSEVFEEVKRRHPKPPRQINPDIPAELERICLKCLAKRQTDRYASAAELLEDLEAWSRQPSTVLVVQRPTGEQASDIASAGTPRGSQLAGSTAAPSDTKSDKQAVPRIVPKGLRSFDEHDADFFLDLLPGARDRDGLPESVRFWKLRIEETDPDKTFRVGLIYGPSGCGKSSLVKAGLLPRLAAHVVPVYLEATPEDTELRLLKGLRRRFSTIPDDLALPDVLAGIREGLWVPENTKVCVVLDQFEQWLHARRGEQDTQLVQALNHCDGARLQCIVLVRDDFWMPVSEFMREVEVRNVEGHNAASVSLFDERHARKVLSEFGKAYRCLPENLAKLTSEEDAFLDSAVSGLTRDGKIICVRLALFADMLKGKPWTTATLSQVGGTEGLGVTFLEETFSSATAPAAHRHHQQAAQAVLKALLPEAGSDIKGGRQSYEALLAASGYGQRPSEFGDLIQILDSEIRLITPTVPAGEDVDVRAPVDSPEPPKTTAEPAVQQEKYYQLTHDYLVPSLRDWLTRKQKETRKGRAELRLADRSALWNAKPENQQLPSLFEFANIRTLTKPEKWTEPQRTMMRRAGKLHLLRTGLAVVLLAAATVAAFKIQHGFVERQQLTQAEGLVNTLVNADTPQVPEIVKQLREYWLLADPLLTQRLAEFQDGSTEKLHLVLALAGQDEQHVEYLYKQLLHADAARLPVIRDALSSYQDRIQDRLWSVLTNPESDPQQQRLHAAGALATYDPQNAKWNDVAAEVASQLVAVNPAFVGQWQDALRPVADRLVPPLAKIFADPQQGELPRSLATSVLADYAKDDVEALTSLVVDADAKTFAELFPVLQKHGQVAVALLQAVLARKVEPTWNDSPLDPAWKEVTPEVQVAIEAGHGMLAERFAFCQDLSWDKFSGVREALEASGYWPTRVRPWLSGDQRLVAAAWTRDGQRRELQTDLTKQQLPTPDVPAEKDGLLPADIAVLPSTDPSAEPQFVALWGPPITAGEQRRMIVDVSKKELTEAQDGLAKAGFAAQMTIYVWTDAAGQRHYAGIWSNQGAPSELRAAYAGFELVHQPQWDVAVAPAAKLQPADPLDAYREQLTQIAALPAAQLDQPQPRLLRAQAQYHLGELEPALADLDFLVEKQAVSTAVLQYRAWTLARLGKVDEARAALATYLEQDKDPSTQAYVQIVLAAWLGNFDEAARQLEAMVTASPQNTDTLYNAACAAALASQACADSDAARSKGFLDRALEVLDTAVTQGYKDAQQLRTDIDLAPLHGDLRFLTLLEKLEPPGRFAAVWRADVEFESRLTILQSPESLLEQARELATQGFRPVAIAISEPPADATTGSSPPASRLPPEASVVWHRPLVPDDQKEQLAVRQASAAVALLRLQQAEQVWPLLKHASDPRLRSYLLDRLASHGSDPESLWQRLLVERDDSTRRALILGLGDFAEAKLLTSAQQATISGESLRLYQEDPDPGIHAAAEWTLKQLGKKAEVATVRSALATGELLGQRRWYVTKQGQHTMVILQPHEPFLMGSPVSEAERYEGPTGRNEMRHRRSIGRTFAIAAHEVTVEQFLAVPFLADHDCSRQYSREADAPVNSVTWYQAVQYCNWLSQQEGLPEDQWCYDPSQPFADGMRLHPDYLRRTGYRLPTEAEWEYGCRALATTARLYGESTSLLGKYAWYIDNSQQRWMLPVGSLRPNDFGLCDMLGNAMEWCQDKITYYPTDRPLVEDAEQVGVVRDSEGRVLRGGSSLTNAPLVRSADRNLHQPDYRLTNNGFRVARTYP